MSTPLIHKLKNIFRLEELTDKIQRKTDDAMAFAALKSLFPPHTILPFNQFSINPFTLLHIIQDIHINGRKTIVEFGSGLSTIIIAQYLQLYKPTATFVSIEDNEEWSTFIQQELKAHGLSNIVQLVTAPLVKEENKLPWYHSAIVETNLGSKQFDMVIVDGPSAKYGASVREPALNVLQDQLAQDCIVFLDDTRREGEAAILLKWKALLESKGRNPKTNLHRVYGTITCGHHFSAAPISH